MGIYEFSLIISIVGLIWCWSLGVFFFKLYLNSKLTIPYPKRIKYFMSAKV